MHGCLRKIKINYVVDDGIQVSRQKTRLCAVGVTEKTIEDLFEPYQSSRPDGSGLGLATVKKIIDAHNGTITVVSEPGKGTAFIIKLLLAPSEDVR